MAAFLHLERAPASGTAADRVIILLHGYGSSGQRAIEQAEWLSKAFPAAHFYAPHGTYEYNALLDPKSEDMGEEPQPGRHVWYHRYSEAMRQEGLEDTKAKLDRYVDECGAAHGVGRDRVALVGMSQGAITVLNCVPYFDQPVGAAVAHSGYLFSPDSLASRQHQVATLRDAVLTDTPICSIHGYMDAQLPWQSHIEAASLLDEAGIPVEFHLLGGLKHADFEPRSQAVAIEFIQRMLG